MHDFIWSHIQDGHRCCSHCLILRLLSPLTSITDYIKTWYVYILYLTLPCMCVLCVTGDNQSKIALDGPDRSAIHPVDFCQIVVLLLRVAIVSNMWFVCYRVLYLLQRGNADHIAYLYNFAFKVGVYQWIHNLIKYCKCPLCYNQHIETLVQYWAIRVPNCFYNLSIIT